MYEFIIQFLKNPMKIGAVLPSSKCLAKGMMKGIDFSSCSTIVEYGPGTGVFTQQIIHNKKKDARLLVIEQNNTLYELLSKRYDGIENVTIIHGSAERIKDYLEQNQMESVDLIVSGLPFTSFPKELTKSILNRTGEVLNEKGKFITFQYTLVKRHIFEAYFQIVNCQRVIWNCPPAFVLVMKKDLEWQSEVEGV